MDDSKILVVPDRILTAEELESLRAIARERLTYHMLMVGHWQDRRRQIDFMPATIEYHVQRHRRMADTFAEAIEQLHAQPIQEGLF
jgi:hypothetical protein